MRWRVTKNEKMIFLSRGPMGGSWELDHDTFFAFVKHIFSSHHMIGFIWELIFWWICKFACLQIANAKLYKGIELFFKEFCWKICFWSAAKNASHIIIGGWCHLATPNLLTKNQKCLDTWFWPLSFMTFCYVLDMSQTCPGQFQLRWLL